MRYNQKTIFNMAASAILNLQNFGILLSSRPWKYKLHLRTKFLTQSTEMWEKFRNSQIQDGGRTPYWKSFFGYNSAPYGPIKTKFGMRRQNHTRTMVSWWKCQISKIQHGGWPPFWKSLYLHISAATCPNFTKLSMRTQILPQATETTKNQKFANSKWRMDAALKITFRL